MKASLRPFLFLVSAILLQLLPAPSAFGIDIPPELKKRLLGESDAKSFADGSGTEALDNSLDPQRYLVGGGDRFQISIVGMPSQEYSPTVDPEGILYDGDLGIIPVGKLPLSQAKAVISDKVKKTLRRNYEVYVALRKIKTSTVTVTGMVANPGTLSLPGNLRILDALKQANGGNIPSSEKFNLRRIRVRNGDSLNEYDMFRFLNRQDLDQNPYVYPGDLIAIDQIDARIYVMGEIRDFASGWVPIKAGETAGDVFDILNLRETADSGAVLIQRSSEKSREPMKRMTLAQARSIPVFNNDIISIGAKESEGRGDTVRVTGEVKRPGTYPVPSGGGSAKDLIELAGGPSDHGSPDRVYILRHRKRDELISAAMLEKNAAGLPGPKTGNMPMVSVRPEMTSSVIDLANSGDFTLVDPSGKSGGLQDGDEIFIPRKENCIYVSGNVRKPGAYAYVSGRGYKRYIDEADGYTDKADTKNMYVLASYKGVTQVKGLDDLAPGDIIVVPAAIEYKRWLNVYMPIIQIMPGILSLIVTLVVLDSKTSN